MSGPYLKGIDFSEHKYKHKYEKRIIIEKIKARVSRLLNEAVKRGEVIKPNKCSNCDRKKRIYGHHDDYSKPLDVVWVCALCHSYIHYKIMMEERYKI